MSTYARRVHANRGVEAWYRRRLELMVRDMAKSALAEMRAAWKANDPALAQDADPTTRMRWAISRWSKLWDSKLGKLADEVARGFVGRAQGATQASMQSSFRAAGFTVKFKPTAKSIKAAQVSVAENVALIKTIPAQFAAQIEQAVWASARVGGDLSVLTKTLQQKYGVAHRRAAFIARDQNHKVKATIERTRRGELGIKKARWRHSHAGKVPRPEHVAADGELYEVSKGMFLEGVWTWPGEQPNCRCTDEPLIPGLDDDE